MTVPKPIAMLTVSLAVLALGLAVLLHGPQDIFAPDADLTIAMGADAAARPAWATIVEAGFAALGGVAVIYLLLRTRIRWAGLFVLAAMTAFILADLLLAREQQASLNVLAPGAVLMAVFAAGAGMRVLRVHKLKQELRLAFADSLPRAAIEKIARDPALLCLDGETRNVTYLVCGVRNLTELANCFRDKPKDFTELAERILTPLMAQILRHGGVIDRLTAEGFTAYWNAPLYDADHAAHACEAADGMMAVMMRANEDLTAQYRLGGGANLPAIEIGVGIATGPAIAGGFSRHGRLSYGINGDAVRLAMRLQILSGNYGPSVIVAEETQAQAGRGFAFLEVDYIAQAEDDAPIRLYAMLDSKSARTTPKIRALSAFHEHIFRCLKAQQWDKARALVEQCSRLSGACHTLYQLYLARIRYFESHPPGPGWDGAFRPILK